MPKRSHDATVQVGLRLKESLRRLLESEAKKEGRSLNQELVRRLEMSFSLEEELAKANARFAEREFIRQASKTFDQLREALEKAGVLVTSPREQERSESPLPLRQTEERHK